MNQQKTETTASNKPEPDETRATIGLDNTKITCANVCSEGSWKRMDGKEIRWRWTGKQNIPLCDLLEQKAITHQFPSVTNPGQSIHLCKLSDGGIVSYELENGVWLHTLNTANSFRMKVFELNLVPLESLRYFLTAQEILEWADTDHE